MKVGWGKRLNAGIAKFRSKNALLQARLTKAEAGLEAEKAKLVLSERKADNFAAMLAKSSTRVFEAQRLLKEAQDSFNQVKKQDNTRVEAAEKRVKELEALLEMGRDDILKESVKRVKELQTGR